MRKATKLCETRFLGGSGGYIFARETKKYAREVHARRPQDKEGEMITALLAFHVASLAVSLPCSTNRLGVDLSEKPNAPNTKAKLHKMMGRQSQKKKVAKAGGSTLSTARPIIAMSHPHPVENTVRAANVAAGPDHDFCSHPSHARYHTQCSKVALWPGVTSKKCGVVRTISLLIL